MTFRSVAVRYTADVGSLVRDLDRAAKANDQLAGKSSASGKAMDVAAGAAVGLTLAMGVGVAKFAEFDAQMSAVAAASGATGKQLDSLREAAMKAGADTAFSATEAAQGVTELAKAGVEAEDILAGGLNGALSLAAAGQMGVAEAAETAASAMTQFGLSGGDVEHIADLLAAGANKAQGSVHDLGQALNQAGLVANATGLSIEETTGGLAAFASAGMIGSDAGTSFKTMLQRLSAPMGDAAGLMEELGINAYDSNGEFVGLAQVAGQLERGMKDLTPAQRNAAMATIFGADAVRSANVLYEQGARGIADWIEKVDEQGAASETAAKLLDNLKGDVEALSGSLETVFIEAGSGANDTLRFLVQGATGFVNAIGKIPGPVLMVTTGLAALALGLPKGISMWKGYTRSLDDAGLSMAKITTRAPKLGAALRGVQGAAAGAAVAAGIGMITNAFTELEALDLDPKKFTATGDAVGYINQQMAANADLGLPITESLTNLNDVLATTFSPSTWQNINAAGAKFNELFMFENTSEVEVARQRLEELDETLAQMAAGGNTAGAKNAFDQVAEAAKAQGVTVDELKAKFPQYVAALDAIGPAASTAASGTGKMATEAENLQEQAQDAEDALNGLKTAVDLLAGGELALRAATREMGEAMDAATESNTKAWKEGKTAAEIARGQEAALDAIATSTDEVIKQQMENNASTKEVTETYEAGRKKILEVLKARGVHGKEAEKEADKIMGTKDEMQKLIDTYGKTPARVTTTIDADTGTAMTDILSLQRALALIPANKQVSFTAKVDTALRGVGYGVFQAAGGVVEYHAAGDVRNGHVAQVVPGGTWRVFGEDETQGESYIPHANDWRRPRAKQVLEVTAAKFGGQVQWFAGGGLRGLGAGGSGVVASGVVDYDRMGRAIGRHMPPMLNVQSGADARTAVREGIDDWEWEQRHGRS